VRLPDVIPEAKSEPQRAFLFSLPHSGRLYPDDFLVASRFDATAIRATEDAFVDDLLGFDSLPVTALKANYARAFIDVNRDARELDPRLINGPLPRGSLSSSPQVKNGYGVVPRCLHEGAEIYRQSLSLMSVLERIDVFHKPYHACLLGLIVRLKAQYGRVVVLDWHSMPSFGPSFGPSSGPQEEAHNRADIVLGDLYGISCTPDLRRDIKSAFEAVGLKVAINAPFAGGYTTKTYGQPHKGVETLQIEINRKLYMDEAGIIPNRHYGRLKEQLQSFLQRII
jgi:N-formylglutamate amidohydrolase